MRDFADRSPPRTQLQEIERLEKYHSDDMKKPYYWGYVSGAEAGAPADPKLWTAATQDPYAPFAFNQGMQWESYYYDDGSM